MDFKQTDNQKRGVFKAVEDGKDAGELTYSWTSGHQITIEHTEVNPEFSGRGLGKALVMEAVAFARKEGLEIIPVCPFAKSLFEKVDDIKDVLAD